LVAGSAEIEELQEFDLKEIDIDLWMYRALKPRALEEYVQQGGGEGFCWRQFRPSPRHWL